MIVAVAVVLAVLFGGGDQYLGSFSAHPWMADVSLLSAPWLVLPFLAGSTQPSARRAAWLGVLCTFAALTGYCAMTLSPVENAHVSLIGIAGFVRSDPPVFVGAVVTGPVFGWLGHRWRSDRAWWAAAGVAATLCLEPVARVVYGNAIKSSLIAMLEIGAGLALAVVLASAGHRVSPRGPRPRP